MKPALRDYNLHLKIISPLTALSIEIMTDAAPSCFCLS